jgi:hypothetical protein
LSAALREPGPGLFQTAGGVSHLGWQGQQQPGTGGGHWAVGCPADGSATRSLGPRGSKPRPPQAKGTGEPAGAGGGGGQALRRARAGAGHTAGAAQPSDARPPRAAAASDVRVNLTQPPAQHAQALPAPPHDCGRPTSGRMPGPSGLRPARPPNVMDGRCVRSSPPDYPPPRRARPLSKPRRANARGRRGRLFGPRAPANSSWEGGLPRLEWAARTDAYGSTTSCMPAAAGHAKAAGCAPNPIGACWRRGVGARAEGSVALEAAAALTFISPRRTSSPVASRYGPFRPTQLVTVVWGAIAPPHA